MKLKRFFAILGIIALLMSMTAVQASAHSNRHGQSSHRTCVRLLADKTDKLKACRQECLRLKEERRAACAATCPDPENCPNQGQCGGACRNNGVCPDPENCPNQGQCGGTCQGQGNCNGNGGGYGSGACDGTGPYNGQGGGHHGGGHNGDGRHGYC